MGKSTPLHVRGKRDGILEKTLEKQKRAGRFRVPPGIVCEVVTPRLGGITP
jgi:hypothetical protein